MRLLVSLGVFLCLVLIAAYFLYGLTPISAEGSSRPFTVAPGEGFRVIAGRLSQESFIRSIGVFKVYSLLVGAAQSFRPGSYELASTMSVPEIINHLTRGGVEDVTVTLPEGLSVKDSITLLREAGVLADDAALSFRPQDFADRYQFLSSATSFEGFLFPDTYRFSRGSDAREVLDTMLATFQQKAWPLLEGGVSWYEQLTLASLLEREVPGFDDRTVVAGILLARNARSIPLQVDATVSYAVCEGEYRGCSRANVTRADLAAASPYNTYQHLGWPPTPIANPGEAALRAASMPRTTPYLYYLSAAKDGATIYAKTLEEHNENKARHL